MKMFTVLFTSLVLVFFSIHCGSSGDQSHTQGTAANNAANQTSSSQTPHAKPGENKEHTGGNQNQEIDLNSPNIPPRLKEAIKSGKITKERAKEILARMQGSSDAPTVQIGQVKRQLIHSFLELNGVVEPERLVEVYSRLSAYVKKIVKEEGDMVKKNDVLALLDDTEISFSYRQAQIELEQAKLTLSDEEISYNRNRKLKETDMISEQDFQTSQASYNKAKLDYQTKQENFKDLELQLSYTRITSPVDGYVTLRSIEVGTRVNSNQQVYRVEDFTPLLVKVYVPTSDVVNLENGMEANVSTDVLKGMVFTGKIKLINPRIDEQSGTVKVTIEVYDQSTKLKPGMFVDTKILIRNNPNALVIPRKCVSYKEDEAYVFVFTGGKGQPPAVKRRVVKLGVSEGDDIEVIEGLEENERVVTVGVESLKDDMKVNVVR